MSYTVYFFPCKESTAAVEHSNEQKFIFALNNLGDDSGHLDVTGTEP